MPFFAKATIVGLLTVKTRTTVAMTMIAIARQA